MVKKLIIIDDSPTSLNFLKTAFSDRNWEAYGATSVKEAMDIIYNVAPDLIITDAIMPKIGGFQFIKMTRQNLEISQIPIIVYSVLPESNAKFYIKEDLGEYFLSKKDDPEELLKMSENVVKRHPLSNEYKNRIKMIKIQNIIRGDKNEANEPEEKIIEKNDIDKDNFEQKFKEKYNFTLSDEKIFTDIFPLLYKILNYNLCTITVDCFEKKEKVVFCDIKDIILSPIFQKNIMEKFSASDIILIKKYAPNLKMIINEDEFLSKIGFDFEYKNENIANIMFYATEKDKWQNENNNEIIEEVLYRFFKARYVNKKVAVNKKDNFAEKYFTDKFDFSIFNKTENTKENMYTCIIEIANYSDIKDNISSIEEDILSSKISEKIMSCLDNEEQVYKNDEYEYAAIVYAKDKKHAQYKLNCILNRLNEIKIEDIKVEAIIGASNCTIEGSYNIYEAQKKARNALEKTTEKEKAVIEE